MKSIPFLGALILFVSIFALPAIPDHRQKKMSTTKAFLINGKRYLLEKIPGGDASLIRRELLRRGLDVHIQGNARPGNPYFEDALREDNRMTPNAPFAIPQGLHPEHVVQMVSDSGPVELAVGSTDAGHSARNHLFETEWKRIESAQGRNPIAVAMRNNGKENLLVFLEEKSGKFLLMRKPE